RLGFAIDPDRVPGITLLKDGRMVLAATGRVALLGHDGSVEADETVRTPSGRNAFIEGPFEIDRQTGGVVFLAGYWEALDPPGGNDWSGWEGVYEVAAGAHQRLLFGRDLGMAPCAHWATFAFRGRWILYAATEGRAVLVNA